MKIFLDIPQNTFAQHETVTIPVYLDTQHESINVVDGVIHIPTDIFNVQEVRDGNSAINFWLQKPAIHDGMVSFSGITPGGFSGPHELLFTIIVQANTLTGSRSFTTHVDAFRNDGQGTLVTTPDTSVQISVTNQGVDSSQQDILDTVPPESFQPIIGRSPALFDGNYFIAFSTQDKGVGMDHYQIREGFFGKYKNAESPFVLRDQALHTRIMIKAVDHNGNSRSASVPAIWGVTQYVIVSLFGIILLGIITRLVSKKVWRKYIR